LITYWSTPKDLKPGRYKVEFECNLPLKANDLKVTIGLSENGRNFYYFEEVGGISITSVATGKQPFQSSGAGLLFDPRDVEIEEC